MVDDWVGTIKNPQAEEVFYENIIMQGQGMEEEENYDEYDEEEDLMQDEEEDNQEESEGMEDQEIQIMSESSSGSGIYHIIIHFTLNISLQYCNRKFVRHGRIRTSIPHPFPLSALALFKSLSLALLEPFLKLLGDRS